MAQSIRSCQKAKLGVGCRETTDWDIGAARLKRALEKAIAQPKWWRILLPGVHSRAAWPRPLMPSPCPLSLTRYCTSILSFHTSALGSSCVLPGEPVTPPTPTISYKAGVPSCRRAITCTGAGVAAAHTDHTGAYLGAHRSTASSALLSALHRRARPR